jgi:hypothetical protein
MPRQAYSSLRSGAVSDAASCAAVAAAFFASSAVLAASAASRASGSARCRAPAYRHAACAPTLAAAKSPSPAIRLSCKAHRVAQAENNGKCTKNVRRKKNGTENHGTPDSS